MYEISHRSHPSEYGAWGNARYRCDNPAAPAYALYGGRGIQFDAAWRGTNGFRRFLEDLGPRPSADHQLDRMNNDGHYEPGNCRWATKQEQAMNRRTTRWIEFNGERMTLSDWARRLGITKQTLRRRITKWGLTRALTTAKQEEYDHGL